MNIERVQHDKWLFALQRFTVNAAYSPSSRHTTYRNLLVFSAVSSSSTKSCNLLVDNDHHHLIIWAVVNTTRNDALLMKIVSSIKNI